MTLAINIRDVITFVVGLASFCAGVGFMARPARRGFRDLRDMREALIGEPAQPELGKPARPGLFVTVAALVDTVDGLQSTVGGIAHEVQSNGGGSLKDAVLADLAALKGSVAALTAAGEVREAERRARDSVSV